MARIEVYLHPLGDAALFFGSLYSFPIYSLNLILLLIDGVRALLLVTMYLILHRLGLYIWEETMEIHLILYLVRLIQILTGSTMNMSNLLSIIKIETLAPSLI